MPSKEFTYTGVWKTWDIPNKVEWVEVEVDGAGSGERPGGRVTGRINVKGRKKLALLVGQKGTRGGGETVGGGGAAGKGRGLPDGWSGGGASIIRFGSATGAVKAVAGGAGGDSGDSGHGGAGGGDVGAAGAPGTTGTGQVGNATGGTQVQGGNPGTSSLGTDLSGFGAPDKILGAAGDGGGPGRANTAGGGGGGGGYYGGGGGQAGLQEQTPGGGGGGGSSFVGGLTSFTNAQGGGSTGHGRITLTWVTPAPANQPPTPPTEVKVRGDDYTAEMATLSTGRARIEARVKDPNGKNKVRLVVKYSPDATFRQTRTLRSPYVESGKRAAVTLEGLGQNILWHLRLYTQDRAGLVSTNYTAVRFWTNRSPNAPEPQSPGDNATISSLDSVPFSWNHSDPDHPQVAHQKAFNLQWRRAGTALFPAGQWKEVTYASLDETYVGEPEDFKASTMYEWRVRTQDLQSAWGPFSRIRSFFVVGATAPPWVEFPQGNEAVEAGDGVTFSWQFRDPGDDALQATADLRYRRVGTSDWITLVGSDTLPGPETQWHLSAGELAPGHWEWEVRTRSTLATLPGDWSDTAQFWLVTTPGATAEPVVDVQETIDARLGCGQHRVFIYQRGGEYQVGEVAPLVNLQWTRRRDDIGQITVNTNGFSADCGALLREVHCWTHELVVFRDDGTRLDRVAEGPITRLTDTPTGFHIEAKDVMGYPYRRLMRQGYNDTYRVINNVQYGSESVVRRARQILMNALAPDDPNVLPYLTSFEFPDDARESRAVPDMAKTAWEEVDSLAATAGLDYSVVGRRIILNDTHRPIGRLAEMRTQHFDSPPVVSEYGMLYANVFGVTNNNGLYGLATRHAPGDPGSTGLVEMLASAYGEDQGGGAAETMDSEAQGELERILTLQAERSIASRYPIPLVVRVPDSSMLMPDTPVKINHLVPGVWIPLRAQGTVREVAQWQKLDMVTVTEDSTGEKVTVTMSPAPNRGQDPDSETEVIE